MAEPTRRERRILEWMKGSNRIFEVLGRKTLTLYDDEADRDRRISRPELDRLVSSGWIRQVPDPLKNHIDSWEITPEGRAILQSHSSHG